MPHFFYFLTIFCLFLTQNRGHCPLSTPTILQPEKSKQAYDGKRQVSNRHIFPHFVTNFGTNKGDGDLPSQMCLQSPIFPYFCYMLYIIKVRARRILCSAMPHFVLHRATVEHKMSNCRAQNEPPSSTKWRTMEHKMGCRGTPYQAAFCPKCRVI